MSKQSLAPDNEMVIINKLLGKLKKLLIENNSDDNDQKLIELIKIEIDQKDQQNIKIIANQEIIDKLKNIFGNCVIESFPSFLILTRQDAVELLLHKEEENEFELKNNNEKDKATLDPDNIQKFLSLTQQNNEAPNSGKDERIGNASNISNKEQFPNNQGHIERKEEKMSKNQSINKDFSKPNGEFWYSGNHILKLWEQYLKSIDPDISFYTSEGTTISSIFNGLSQFKEVALVINQDNMPYQNKDGNSISLCGEINFQGDDYKKIDEAIAQVKQYNNSRNNIITKHIIIFPYHVNSVHWNFGQIQLTLNANNNIMDVRVNIYEPYGGIAQNAENTVVGMIKKLSHFNGAQISPGNINHLKQQNDGAACGAITVENGKEFLKRSNDNNNLLQKSYQLGAEELRKQHMEQINDPNFNKTQSENIDPCIKGDNAIKNGEQISVKLQSIIGKDENDWVKSVIDKINSNNNEEARNSKNLFKQFIIEQAIQKDDDEIINALLTKNGSWQEGAMDLINTLVLRNYSVLSLPETKNNEHVSNIIDQQKQKDKLMKINHDSEWVTKNIISKIITHIDKALGAIKEKKYEEVQENLFKISWRSSEIPSEIRFDKSKFELSEKQLIRLDYLSNALIDAGDNNLKQQFFDNLNGDLEKFKLILNNQLNQEDKGLPKLESFISFYYDQYLLSRIIDQLKIIQPHILKQNNDYYYAGLRVLEIIGEVFKSLSNNVLELFADDVRTNFRELRNVIQHNRSKLELIIKHKPQILSDVLEVICTLKESINNILKQLQQSNKVSYPIPNQENHEKIFSFKEKIKIELTNIANLTKILNTKTFLSKEEKKKFQELDLVDQNMLEPRIFLGEEARIDNRTGLDNIINCLQGNYDDNTKKAIKEILWKVYHQIPIDDYEKIMPEIEKGKNTFKAQDFKNKLIKRLESYDKELGKQIISYGEVLNSIKKIEFSSAQDEDRLEKLMTAYFMEDKKYKSLKEDLGSIGEIIGDGEKKSLDQIFAQLDLLKQEMSDQVSIIKKFYYKKFLNDKKPEVLSLINKILPVPFDINQFKKIDDYEERLKNLSKIGKIFEQDGNLEVAKKFSALSQASGSLKYKEELKIKFTKKIEELTKAPEYVNYFNVLDTKKTINEVMEYINLIIDAAPKKQVKNLEDIRTFYLSKFLQDNKSEVKSFIQHVIDENIKETSSFDLQAFKEKLKVWIEIGEMASSSFNEILLDLEKINFSHGEDKENLRYFLDTLVMSNNEYQDLTKKIDQLKTEKRLQEIFNSLDQQNELAKLFEVFKKLREDNFKYLSKIEKVLLRDFTDKQLSEVINFIQNIVLQNPADILEKIITNNTLEFSDNEKYDQQKINNLGQKLLFTHTKEYSYKSEGSKERTKDFTNIEKSETFKVFPSIFKSLNNPPPEQKKNKSEDHDTNAQYLKIKLKKIVEKIEKIEKVFIQLNNELESDKKSILKLSAQFLLEEIGSKAQGLYKDPGFQDYGYISISKRQFLILNIARKAMAHHPIYIDDEKLEFYVEQLVLDSQFRLKEVSQDNTPKNYIAEDLPDFMVRRNIDFKEVEQKKNLIKNIIFANGFDDQIIVFNKSMGCDIGVQGDLVFAVFPIPSKPNSLAELELELSYYLNCNVMVYTSETLQSNVLSKLTKEHQSSLLKLEEVDDFLTTKKFEHIYDEQSWTKATIPDKGDVYKNRDQVSKENFAKATLVEYVFSQEYKNEQRKKTKEFRQDRIENIPEIKRILLKESKKLLNTIKNLDRREENITALFMIREELKIKQQLFNYYIQNEFMIQKKYSEFVNPEYFIDYAFYRRNAFFSKFPGFESSKIKDLLYIKDYFVQFNLYNYNELKKKLLMINKTEIINNIIEYLRGNFSIIEKIFHNIFNQLKEDYSNNFSIQYNFSNEILLSTDNKVECLFNEKSLYYNGCNTLNDNKVTIVQVYKSVVEDNNIISNSEYIYFIPYTANGILGFSSELDKELKRIHDTAVKPEQEKDPSIYIKSLGATKSYLVNPQITYRFNAKAKTLGEFMARHQSVSNISEADKKKSDDYYQFRPKYELLRQQLSMIKNILK